MATYVYRCGACAGEFEAQQSMQAEPLTRCERCGGPVRRVIQPVGIAFNGTGFYATDNRSFRDYKDEG